MSHTAGWCGCDPNHLPTHVRGGTGCVHADDPHEKLIRDSEEFLVKDGSQEFTAPIKWGELKSEAATIIQRWLTLHARP